VESDRPVLESHLGSGLCAHPAVVPDDDGRARFRAVHRDAGADVPEDVRGGVPARHRGAHGVNLTVRVQPGARRSGLVGRMSAGTLKLAVTAPPEGGRANAAVVELLAATLGVRPRQLEVVRGASARTKVIAVAGLEGDAVAERIDAALGRKDADGE